MVTARLSCRALDASETAGTEDMDDAEDDLGGVDEPGDGVRLRGSSSDDAPESESRDIRDIRGK